jgi:hypothetical protein
VYGSVSRQKNVIDTGMRRRMSLRQKGFATGSNGVVMLVRVKKSALIRSARCSAAVVFGTRGMSCRHATGESTARYQTEETRHASDAREIGFVQEGEHQL